MHDVGDDDISPWARDDWTADSEPRLDSSASPDPPGDRRSTPARGSHGPTRMHVLLAGAVGLGFVVFGVVGLMRDDPGDPVTGTSEPASAPLNGRAAGTDPVGTDVPITVPSTGATPTAPPGTVVVGAASNALVVGDVPVWSESSIVVPSPLDSISSTTEVLTITGTGVLQRTEFPTGTTRSLDVSGLGPDTKLAASDDTIVLSDGRVVTVIEDDVAVRQFTLPDTVLFAEAWPGTRSFVVTITSSVSAQAERLLLDIDDGSLQPLTADVADALVLGAGNFLASGELLVNQPGGVYALTPDGAARRIGDGDLLAVGRNHYAVNECDESLSCSQFVVDASTGQRVPAMLDGLSRYIVEPSTRVSPDGSAIVTSDRSRDTGYRQIVDVVDGRRIDIGRLVDVFDPDTWAADGSGLFVDEAGVLRFHVNGTGAVADVDGLGRIGALFVRPGRVSGE